MAGFGREMLRYLSISRTRPLTILLQSMIMVVMQKVSKIETRRYVCSFSFLGDVERVQGRRMV